MPSRTGLPERTAACTSFLAQLHILAMMRPEKLPPYVLVVGSDSLTKTVDYSDRSASVLWGDGSAARGSRSTRS